MSEPFYDPSDRPDYDLTKEEFEAAMAGKPQMIVGTHYAHTNPKRTVKLVSVSGPCGMVEVENENGSTEFAMPEELEALPTPRPTPRTDAEDKRLMGLWESWPRRREGWLKHARQLERELAEAREQLSRALTRGDEALAAANKAERELQWSDIQDKRDLAKQLAEAREQHEARVAEMIEMAEAQLSERKELIEQRDRLAEALRELNDAPWLRLPGRAWDIIQAALATLNRKEEG